MSVLNSKEKSDLIDKVNEYDYIRFSWPDLNGIARGKTVPGRYAGDSIADGVAMLAGTICFGPRSEFPHIARIHDDHYCNANFVPATGITDLPWATQGGKYKVGQVICDAFWSDGSPIQAAPRMVARKQIDRLDDMGYKLFSGFELEFLVVDSKTKKPVFQGVDFALESSLSKHAEWLFDVEKQLASVGIDIGAMHTEYSPGVFEFAMEPKYGMDPFDGMFIMKQALREILPKYGLQPTFMSWPFRRMGAAPLLHFNNSLWTANGKNAFYDASKPDNMSDTMRYWIGGIIKHINSVLVLCSPTPNCFRRLHTHWYPGKADWGVDNRLVSIRTKTYTPGACLVENRLPTPASNPYLVVAATVAAGIDGIQNKIEPPPSGQHDSSETLPSFDECVKALQEDRVMVEALGEEFVDWWVSMKTQFEMKKFAYQTKTNTPAEELEAERQEYFDDI